MSYDLSVVLLHLRALRKIPVVEIIAESLMIIKFNFVLIPTISLVTVCVCVCVKTSGFLYNCFSDQGNDQYWKKISSDFSSVILSVAIVYGCGDNHM